MRNFRLVIAYDGTDYFGWQFQPDKMTIQQQMETAIEKITQEQLRVTSAGRTDAGVHALGQVVQFHSRTAIPCQKLQHALQSQLPTNIVILSLEEVEDDFHPTYAAKQKRYRYVILNHSLPNPFFNKYVWTISDPLNADAMNQAAQSLVGKHDFRSFESNYPNRATSVRTVKELTIQRVANWTVFGTHNSARLQHSDASEKEFICIDIVADGFLYNMVRAITGTLVEVGRGKWDISQTEKILHAQNRDAAGPTAPPQGLYLVQVDYEK